MTDVQEVHFEGKVAQKAIIVRSDGKVLITRDSRDTDTWELPGGRLNQGERPQEGLARELREELGIEVNIAEPVYVGTQEHKRDGSVMLVVAYRAVLKDESTPFSVDPIEVSAMEWVDKDSSQAYQLFPEYAAALQEYFARL